VKQRPSDVQDLLDQLEAAEREAASLMAGLDDARANWQPDEGRGWSAAQCLDHLARATEEYLARMGDALAEARARLAAGAGRWPPASSPAGSCARWSRRCGAGRGRRASRSRPRRCRPPTRRSLPAV
jgi:hypothetical protein